MDERTAVEKSYEETGNELARRIAALGEKVLGVENPFDLFKMGLKCRDLEPTFAQACWALGRAKTIIRESGGH